MFTRLATALSLLALAGAAHAQEPRPQGPYFFVAGGDPDVDRLPLKSTSAEVRVAAR